MKHKRILSSAAGAALLALSLSGGGAEAADHTDPSTVDFSGDNAADIGDFYAWNTDTLANGGNLVMALTFAGPDAASSNFTGDRDVLYGMHIDNDGDAEPDLEVYVRFGQDAQGRWGYRVEGLPGIGDTVSFVGEAKDLGGARVFAGVRDDPFFFDLTGFLDTVATGDLQFASTRDGNGDLITNPAALDAPSDTFAGANISTIVIELPLSEVVDDASSPSGMSAWATTSEIR